MPQEDKVDLSDLYPGLDPEQLELARGNLESYLGVNFRIWRKAGAGFSPEAELKRQRDVG